MLILLGLQCPALSLTHANTLTWRIPRTEEPGRLQSMGSLRVGHGWATSLSLFTFMHWRRKWQPIPVFLPGESQGRGSLMCCRLWGHTDSDTAEAAWQQQQQQEWARGCFPGHSAVKNLPAMQETRVQSLGQEDPLEKETATHSRILAWEIPWTEELRGLWSTWSQSVWHDWVTKQPQKLPPVWAQQFCFRVSVISLAL